MGYYADNTVEMKIDGVVQRVFKQEAKKVKEKLIKDGHKVEIKGEEQLPEKK